MDLKKVREKSIANFKLILFYTLISQGLIFLRAKLMAENITGYYNVDKYLVAILAATYIAEIISEGLLVSLVPVFHRAKEDGGDEGRFRFVNNMANIMMVFSLGMMVVGLIFAPYIVDWYNKDLLGLDFKDAVGLFRMALPMLFFILVRPVYLAYLQSNHGFKAGAKGGMLMNSCYFIYLLLFSRFGIKGLVLAGILAHASYFLVIPKIMKGQGYKYERFIDLEDVNIARLLSLLLPMLIYILLMRLNAKIDLVFSEKIGNVYGILGNANYVVGFMITVIIQTIITISYPLLSEAYIRGDFTGYKEILNTGIRLITTILVPMMVVIIVFARPVTNLFFGNGRGLFFKELVLEGPALEETIVALRYLGMSILFVGLNLLFVRALFSRGDFLGPILAAALSLGINYLLARLLLDSMGEASISLANSISNISLGILLCLRLNQKERLIDLKKMFLNILLSLALSLVVVLVVYLCYENIGRDDLALKAGILVSIYIYYNLYIKVKNKIY